MTIQIEPLSELTDRAINALIREFGVVDTMRFLHQFRAGNGNYTEERKQRFEGMSVKDIVDDIKMRRKVVS